MMLNVKIPGSFHEIKPQENFHLLKYYDVKRQNAWLLSCQVLMRPGIGVAVHICQDMKDNVFNLFNFVILVYLKFNHFDVFFI